MVAGRRGVGSKLTKAALIFILSKRKKKTENSNSAFFVLARLILSNASVSLSALSTGAGFSRSQQVSAGLSR